MGRPNVLEWESVDGMFQNGSMECSRMGRPNVLEQDVRSNFDGVFLRNVRWNTMRRCWAGHPLCGVDKWEDNHYAIDSQTADTAKIVKYIDAKKVIHYCSSQRGLHYAFDPTGWGIQLDLGFTAQPSDCSSSSSAAASSFLRGMPTTGGTFNPACEPGTCT